MSAHPETGGRAAPKSARDFYSELIKDSQSTRAGFLMERERWLRSVQVEGREELLFEFEMLLRGVERYFNLHNLPFDPASPPVVTRDFHDELVDVRDAINAAIKAARQLLDPDSDQRMVFRRYIESTLADDRARRLLLEEELDQDTPQESLFVLRQSFDALRTVIDHLLKLEVCGFALYNDVGSLLLREIVLNRYFRPFRPLEFRLEYDRIKSVRLLESLHELPESTRRLFSTPFLGLFRLLHYLSYVGDGESPPPPRSRVVLALVRSEAASLALYLQEDLATRAELRRHKAAALKASREMIRESARIHQTYLGHMDAGPNATMDAAVALTQLYRKQIVALARALKPELEGATTFEQLVSTREMSERLRLDLWALSRLCEAAGRVFLHGTPAQGENALSAVRAFLQYFHAVSYQLLRYGDYEPFDRFAALVGETERIPPGEAQRQRLGEDFRHFSQVAQTYFAQVSRRRELSSVRFDQAAARALLARFRTGRSTAALS
ncbi:MAG: hypothetical protein IRZ16_08775 [Myxococcaceae bacterium]|nr:hypothetical protein [Myxococcaceae bacterium]